MALAKPLRYFLQYAAIFGVFPFWVKKNQLVRSRFSGIIAFSIAIGSTISTTFHISQEINSGAEENAVFGWDLISFAITGCHRIKTIAYPLYMLCGKEALQDELTPFLTKFSFNQSFKNLRIKIIFVCFLLANAANFLATAFLLINQQWLFFGQFVGKCYWTLTVQLFLVYTVLAQEAYRKINLEIGKITKERRNAHGVKILAQTEQDLSQNVDKVNAIFGLVGVFFMAEFFLDILFTEVLFAHNRLTFSVKAVGYCAISTIETVFYISICSKASEEAEKTAKYLHEIFIENDDPAIREEVEIFSLQLLHRKIEFTACGFFKLDFSLLYSMIGAVTTYIVVLMQFQTTQDASLSGCPTYLNASSTELPFQPTISTIST